MNKKFQPREPIRHGEIIEEEGEVTVIQEVGIGVVPKVKYDGERFIVELDDEVKEFEVGCVEEDSITAEVRNGVLTIKARRCKDESDSEDKEHIYEEEGERD